jgi:hypothetical protein
MPILVNDPMLVSLPWHDAGINLLNVSWSQEGIEQVQLRVEINPEESLQPLIDIGLNGSIVDIQFNQVWWLRTDLRGDTFPREVLLTWKIIQSSPLIREINEHGAAQGIHLHHQQIRLSGGSVIDIVFEQASLDEACLVSSQ